ncbi:hypothetical protein Mp_3g11700 [Marchantia polymorpha subsp. ruderalis]|uniref:Uncharacterized protein n=2 Tax=Marchantia polymorpha TaxID=3197 RepID=A0AAF6AZT0_MARPO|nr:hypothetical protein MARPO_0037s0027 [Marchantia polymorpha]BBN05264.1 hypothetical protein Mp_3g11700 [Marchantia polymorpha subsp. ruderalis]|eukprot:PTQ40841.1 hypothetical protein MARPO_0037s0027 [Marchantia polymorpha]
MPDGQVIADDRRTTLQKQHRTERTRGELLANRRLVVHVARSVKLDGRRRSGGEVGVHPGNPSGAETVTMEVGRVRGRTNAIALDSGKAKLREVRFRRIRHRTTVTGASKPKTHCSRVSISKSLAFHILLLLLRSSTPSIRSFALRSNERERERERERGGGETSVVSLWVEEAEEEDDVVVVVVVVFI